MAPGMLNVLAVAAALLKCSQVSANVFCLPCPP